MALLTIFLCQALCFGEDGFFIYEGTEITQPLSLYNLAVVEDRIFLVDRDGRLLTFDGDQPRQIAGKGEGPGELDRPTRIMLRAGRLYLSDYGKIHVYDSQGTFLQTYRYPMGDLYVGKPKQGLLFLSGLGYGQVKNPMELVLLFPESGERTTIASWEPEQNRNPRSARISFEHISLAKDRSMSQISFDGKLAYTVVSGMGEVHITDIEHRKHLKTIRVKGKPIPFDKDDGREWINRFNKKYGLKKKGDFPEFFPLIDRIILTQEDHLIVFKPDGRLPGVGDLEQWPPHLVYDRWGNPLTPSFLDLNVFRIGWIGEKWLWVYVYNEEADEHTVIRCTRADLKNVLERYPLVY